MRERWQGVDSPEVDETSSRLGALLGSRERHAEAAELFGRLLDARKRALGPDDPAVAEAAHAFGAASRLAGDHGAAESALTDALRIRDAALATNDARLLATVRELGLARLAAGQADAAAVLLERAHTAALASDPGGLSAADTAAELGRARAAQTQWDDALQLLVASLAVTGPARGDTDSRVFTVLDILGTVQRAIGDLEGAEATLRRALAGREGAGRNELEISGVLVTLGAITRDRRNAVEAKQLLDRALEIRERRIGKDSLAVAEALQELGTLERAEWRLLDAERIYLRVLEIRERSLGMEHQAVRDTLLQLERTYLGLGNYGEADRVHRRAAALGV
jgi:tetratricopeptide (TPR) repeat protein